MSWKRNRRAALLCLIFASILLAAAITILQYTSLSKNPEVISEITQAPLSVPLPVRSTSVSEASHASLETQYDLIASIVFPSDRVHNIRLSACIALIVAAGFALLSAFLTPAALTVRLADLLPSAPPLALLSFARPLSGGTVFSCCTGAMYDVCGCAGAAYAGCVGDSYAGCGCTGAAYAGCVGAVYAGCGCAGGGSPGGLCVGAWDSFQSSPTSSHRRTAPHPYSNPQTAGQTFDLPQNKTIPVTRKATAFFPLFIFSLLARSDRAPCPVSLHG